MNKETIRELRVRADEMISAGIANKEARGFKHELNELNESYEPKFGKSVESVRSVLKSPRQQRHRRERLLKPR